MLLKNARWHNTEVEHRIFKSQQFSFIIAIDGNFKIYLAINPLLPPNTATPGSLESNYKS